jgi:hypothetical protein
VKAFLRAIHAHVKGSPISVSGPEYLHKAEFILLVGFVFVFRILQAVRHPLQRHARLRPQALGDPDFPRIAFDPPGQPCLRPPQLVQFFAQEAPPEILRE